MTTPLSKTGQNLLNPSSQDLHNEATERPRPRATPVTQADRQIAITIKNRESAENPNKPIPQQPGAASSSTSTASTTSVSSNPPAYAADLQHTRSTCLNLLATLANNPTHQDRAKSGIEEALALNPDNIRTNKFINTIVPLFAELGSNAGQETAFESNLAAYTDLSKAIIGYRNHCESKPERDKTLQHDQIYYAACEALISHVVSLPPRITDETRTTILRLAGIAVGENWKCTIPEITHRS